MNMIQTPDVSVIIPVYNAEKYLSECIDSILNQSFENFELILVDDGSSDTSGSICDEYSRKDERVKVYHLPNGGVSSARNFGLDKAQGEWITFVDSDDYVGQYYLSFKREEIADVVVFDSKVVCNDGSIRQSDGIPPFYSKNREDINEYLSKYVHKPLLNVPWGKAYKKSIIKNVRFPIGQRLSEDTVFVYEVLSKIESLNVITGSVYYWREPEFCYSKKYHLSIEEVIRYSEIVFFKYKRLHIFSPQKEASLLTYFIWNSDLSYLTNIKPLFKADYIVEIEKRMKERGYKLPFLYLMFKYCKPLALMYLRIRK